jgi:hypothetical protein
MNISVAHPRLSESKVLETLVQMQTSVSDGRYLDFPSNRIKHLVRSSGRWIENEDWHFPQPFDLKTSIGVSQLRARFAEALNLWDLLSLENGGNCSKSLAEIFDREFSIHVRTCLDVDRRTAASAEFWHAIAFRVLPELTYWRWGHTIDGLKPNVGDGKNATLSKNAIDRYLLSNGPRSVYARLWWRAELFGGGALKIPGDLPDQFLERPLSIAVNGHLSRSALWCLLTNETKTPPALQNPEIAASCESSYIFKAVSSKKVTALLSELGRESFTQEISIFSPVETRDWVVSIADRLGLTHQRPDWDELYK